MRRLLLALATLVAAPVLDAQAIPLTEWQVPWERSRPRDPYPAPDGTVFFVGQAGNYLARLDPASGKFTRYEIDPGTHPHNVIVDRAGNAWYAGNRNGMIGKLDPGTGAITRYPMPDPAARDPHTLAFDKAGDIWFTVQNGGFVGKLETKSGKIRLVKVPTNASPNGTRPYGIVVDSRNRPWFDLFGSNEIGTVDPRTMQLKRYPLPDAKARPRRIAVTSDDRIWFVDYTRGFLGRLDPASGKVTEWALPGGPSSLPYAMTSDDQDRLWFVETGRQPNRMIGFDPKRERFFGTAEIASGGGTVRHMVFEPKTRTIWFGSDANTIGKGVVPRGDVAF